MSPKAELVKQISATGFTEAIDLMACLAVLREGESLVVPRALEAANAVANFGFKRGTRADSGRIHL